MREAFPIEREVGIDWFLSESPGTGGSLKQAPEHFRVTEIEGVDFEPLSSDPAAYPDLIVRATLEDWDTFNFARRLARELGLHHEAIRWAGTKDKAAITTQLLSIRSLDTDLSLPTIPGATLEPIGRFGRQLSFGDLLGNEFEIQVEQPTNPEQHEAITAELLGPDDRISVPNYFGQQRFGSVRPVTHQVGKAILDGSWEDAVLTYIGNPSEHEPAPTQAVRAFVDDTHDWEEAFERFPPHLTHERRMCRYLADTDESGETAYRGALDTLSNSLKQLFVHAVQSVLFNTIVSRRLDNGISLNEAVEGDVVCFGQTTDTLGTVPDPTQTQRVTAERVRTINRHIESGRAFVTAPLVGSETEFGSGAVGDIERSVMDYWGLKRADFSLPEPYNSTGYRRAVQVSTALTVELDPLTFSFALPKGSYATVVMREYLKTHPRTHG